MNCQRIMGTDLTDLLDGKGARASSKVVTLMV